MKHFYHLSEFNYEQVQSLVNRAIELKANRDLVDLKNRQVGLLFLNPSLRTRCSFEVALRQMNCGVSTLDAQSLWKLETELGAVMDQDKSEHVREAVGVLSRYFDAIGIRAFAQGVDRDQDLLDQTIRTFMENSQSPVFNMESAMYHPCQAMADLITIQELLKTFSKKKITITWAYHPKALPMAVPNSILLASTLMGMDVTLAHPPAFEIHSGILDMAENHAKKSDGSLRIVNDRLAAAEDADIIYAKAWGGMSSYEDKEQEEAQRQAHKDWIVDSELMSKSNRGLFMHCLPVRRNVVVSDSVLDSARSVVLQQAENRLHGQKAILEWIFS